MTEFKVHYIVLFNLQKCPKVRNSFFMSFVIIKNEEELLSSMVERVDDKFGNKV